MAMAGQAMAAVSARTLGDGAVHIGSSMRKEPDQIHTFARSGKFIWVFHRERSTPLWIGGPA